MALPQNYKAMVVSETAEKTFVREIRERALSDLPAGELIIEVKYSSLNYKDALSATGNKGVTRKYPHTPGIDAAGVIVRFDDQNVFGGRPSDGHRLRSRHEYFRRVRPVHQCAGALGGQSAQRPVVKREHGLRHRRIDGSALHHPLDGERPLERFG